MRTGGAPATPRVAPADFVLRNGKIITVDAASTIAEAIAIVGDRIAAVGPNEAMPAHAGPSTRIVDLKGKAVIPGITDGHAHMDREALRTVFPSLGRVRSIKDIQDRIADLARGKNAGEWVVTMPIGDPPYYFNVPEILAEKRWPTRQELDAAAPNNPVYIRAIWGYWRGGNVPIVSCANTEALKCAGITRDTVSPAPTLTIVKDSNGDPTGVITEEEMQPLAELLWFRAATRFSHADRMWALAESAKLYHAVGTTSIFEGHGAAAELIRVYKQTHRDGTLTMRTTLAFSPDWKAAGDAALGPFVDSWAGWLGEPAIGDDWLKLCGTFLSLGRAPSSDLRASAAPDTGWAGFNYATGLPRPQLKEVLLRCAANDIRVVMNGPPILDLYDEVDREIPLKGKRWVIAHINAFSPRDIERIVRMGLVLTSHTNNYLYKGLHVHAKKLPPERHGDIVPLRSLLDAGVKVSLSTDNVPITNFMPVMQAVARRSFVTKEQVAPQQALSRMQAIRCATADGAYLTNDEAKKGSLESGKFADLAVLTADPLTVEEAKLADIASQMTMVGGRIVHEMPTWGADQFGGHGRT
ncbi:MAG: amidohydrolase [Xanthobacteraceae bacterium]